MPDRLPREILRTSFIGKEQVFWCGSEMNFRHKDGYSIVIPADFLSDGLSIPKVFQSVFSKSPHFIYAGILHDYSYRKDFPYVMSRKEADKMFLYFMKQYGVGFFTRHTIYRAVRIGGGRSYKKQNSKYHEQ